MRDTSRWGTQLPADPSDLALQQVVYTLSAGFQEPLWVVFHRGQSQTDPVSAAPQLEVLSRVNLSDPAEGQVVEDTLAVVGQGQLVRGQRALEHRAGRLGRGAGRTSPLWATRRHGLFPFSGEIDVSSLDPGTYTLIVETDDPSGGLEGGPGVFSDTRTFVIK